MPNIWIGHGQLVDHPERRHTPSGRPVIHLRLLVGALDSDRADVFEVAVYGDLAHTTAAYLSMGRWILVEGTLRQTGTGAGGGRIEIVAKGISFLDAPDGVTVRADT
jgi:single-stranded DNA-binding protein